MPTIALASSEHATIGRSGQRDGASLDRCDVKRPDRPNASDLDAEETLESPLITEIGSINENYLHAHMPWHGR